ncbi:MAG: rod shape-determining protein MreD [Magnetococcales bacterium]|nr:rod shape-determining protein MreD [Magnetococcales bacterium]
MTVFLALAVQEMALPWHAWSVLRPDLVLLCLFYWRLYRPDRCGPVLGFCAGLATDILSGVPLGLHAFTKTIIVMLIGYFGTRLRGADFLFLVPAMSVIVLLEEWVQLGWILMLQGSHVRWGIFVGQPVATALLMPLVVTGLILVHRAWLEET